MCSLFRNKVPEGYLRTLCYLGVRFWPKGWLGWPVSLGNLKCQYHFVFSPGLARYPQEVFSHFLEGFSLATRVLGPTWGKEFKVQIGLSVQYANFYLILQLAVWYSHVPRCTEGLLALGSISTSPCVLSILLSAVPEIYHFWIWRIVSWHKLVCSSSFLTVDSRFTFWSLLGQF